MTLLSKRQLAHIDAGQLDLFMLAPMSPHQRLTIIDQAPRVDADDFAAIAGQEIAKRALEIAAVADHPLQFIGKCPEIDTLIAAGRKIGALQCFHYSDAAPTPLDLNVHVQPTSDVDLRLPPPAESSAEILARVVAARPRLDRWPCNADEQGLEASMEPSAAKLLEDAAKAMRLDDNAVARVWLVARSIAALADREGPMGRIHIAEALSYAWQPPRAPEPPAPPPPPLPAPQAERAPLARERWERIEVDPKRLHGGDIERSYSAQSLFESEAVKSPFRLRGSEWVTIGLSWNGGSCLGAECYRVVAPDAFTGPGRSGPKRYREHDWTQHREQFGSYHGMSAKHGSREIVLQGPPVVFVAGEPEQSALL